MRDAKYKYGYKTDMVSLWSELVVQQNTFRSACVRVENLAAMYYCT